MSFQIERNKENTYFFDEKKRLDKDWRKPLRSLASENFNRQDRELLLISLFSDVISAFESEKKEFKEEHEDIIKGLKRTAVILLDTVIPYKKEIHEVYPNIKDELKRTLQTLKDFTIDLEEANGDISASKGFF